MLVVKFDIENIYVWALFIKLTSKIISIFIYKVENLI